VAQGGRVPRAASAAIDTATGNVYYGQSGSVPDLIHPDLASRLPSPSLEPWPPGNCAEFNACNAALLNGANFENLIYSTIRIGRGGLEPFPSCANCQVILRGAKEIP
jgi:hypothetical protein